MTDMERITHLKKEYEAAVKSVGKKGIKDLLMPLFEKYPEVKAVRWRQYTPYFNDGEVCRFSVGETYISFTDTKEDDGDYEDGFCSPWSCRDKPDHVAAFTEINEAMSIEDDIMLQAFGDHVEVTVDRDGVTVEQYDHD